MSKIDSDHFEHAKLIIQSWPKWKQDINLTGILPKKKSEKENDNG